jgi:hypothetical protein
MINLIQHISNVAPGPNELIASRNKKLIDAQAYFFTEINVYIREVLDPIIAAYNQATAREDRVKKLIEIEQAKIVIEGRYPNFCYSASRDYIEKIQIKLSNQLQAEFKAYAVEKETSDEFPGLIQTMPHEQLDALIQSLLRLKASKEARTQDQSIAVFQNYSISRVNGANNYIYRVIDTRTNQSFVMKIENRLAIPSGLVAQLRNSIPSLHKPYATRQVSYLDNGNYVTRNIEVSPFYEKGNVAGYRKQIVKEPQIIDSAINLHIDIAHIFLAAQNNGAVFTDGKHENYMITHHEGDGDHIVITDTKGFIPINATTLNYVRDSTENTWYGNYVGFVSTLLLAPPECGNNQFNADSFHVFTLGKSLYQYLTGVSNTFFHNKSYVSSYPFDGPLFKMAKGKELAALIKTMIEPKPEKRIKLSQAIETLERMTNPTVQYKAAVTEAMNPPTESKTDGLHSSK